MGFHYFYYRAMHLPRNSGYALSILDKIPIHFPLEICIMQSYGIQVSGIQREAKKNPFSIFSVYITFPQRDKICEESFDQNNHYRFYFPDFPNFKRRKVFFCVALVMTTAAIWCKLHCVSLHFVHEIRFIATLFGFQWSLAPATHFYGHGMNTFVLFFVLNRIPVSCLRLIRCYKA